MELHQIRKAVSFALGIPELVILSPKRISDEVTMARQICLGLAYKYYYPKLSFKELSNVIGRDDHSIVHHHLNKYNNFIQMEKKYKEKSDLAESYYYKLSIIDKFDTKMIEDLINILSNYKSIINRIAIIEEKLNIKQN